MKIHGYDKPIKLFRLSSRGDWRRYEYYIEKLADDTQIGSVTKYDIVELTSKSRKFDPALFGTLTDNATLFFDKSATFPRYKLEGSGYKRCIKKEKADFIIVGKTQPKNSYRSYLTVWEIGDELWVSYYSHNTGEVLAAFNKFGISDAKLLYSGNVMVYPPDAQILLETNPSKPLIWDYDLDKKINTALPVVTESDVKQILAMLASNDYSIIDLGLKTLATFDITSRPLTTLCILAINNKWTTASAATSVAVETMLTSLGVNLGQCRYGQLKSRLGLLNVIKNVSDEDRTLAKKIMKDCAQSLIEKELEPYRRTFESEALSFKITVNVEG